MGRRSFSNGLFFGVGIIVGVLVLLFIAAPQIYLSSENRNFADLREKSKLDCLTMPLHCLVRDGDIDGLTGYLNNGKELELKDNWGRTALYYALWNEKPHILKMLLSAGSDVNTKDDNERSILFQAVAWKKYAVATELLANGADIDALNGKKHPQTALHYCVMKNMPECVELLLNHGADKSLKDSFGYTLYERVRMHSHIDDRVGDLLHR
ncbi:MAG: hypothetical protein B6D77_12810 [gamma proteobacterium symbiont of Ctena orbiculata]|nr:MAG: hypothetical protein B6D77_12810 [gamma proteobacterium symbiont of Ctena orbiculata]PVV22207.1 MAG: hypothetical protein B6D78_05700 [gamma proteobacterium symbiont of Ctena orbiculata]PVV25531.1 MAG: hypothetical protein B6D79_08995 [gamma proteobacterium symbiont of Ctena orbiculata]